MRARPRAGGGGLQPRACAGHRQKLINNFGVRVCFVAAGLSRRTMSYDGVSPRRPPRQPETSVAPEGGDETSSGAPGRAALLVAAVSVAVVGAPAVLGARPPRVLLLRALRHPFQLAFYHSAAGVPRCCRSCSSATRSTPRSVRLLTFHVHRDVAARPEIVSDTASPARRYLRGTFSIDLLGVLPIEIRAARRPAGGLAHGQAALPSTWRTALALRQALSGALQPPPSRTAPRAAAAGPPPPPGPPCPPPPPPDRCPIHPPPARATRLTSTRSK